MGRCACWRKERNDGECEKFGGGGRAYEQADAEHLPPLEVGSSFVVNYYKEIQAFRHLVPFGNQTG